MSVRPDGRVGGLPDESGPGRNPLRLLRDNRRFRNLNLAVTVSAIGDPLSLTVSLILLFDATHSPLSIAAAYLCQMVSAIVVSGLLTSISDRVDRRKLVVRLEVARALLVVLLPLATHASVFLLYPALLLLGAIEAVVQPARQAAVPELVGDASVAGANASLMAGQAIAQSVGFAVAGVLIGVLPDPRVLYVGDALTFGAAAALTWVVGPMGGGLPTTRLRGGLRRGFAVPGVAPLLIVAGGTVIGVGMLNPAILPLAYHLSSRVALTYGVIQIALISGVLAGSLLAGRVRASHTTAALAGSLWLFGAALALVSVSRSTVGASAFFFLSGAGNAGYSITNVSALMWAATDRNRGTVMAARVTTTQAANVVGLGIGAVITSAGSPRSTFLVAALLLCAIAATYSSSLLAVWAIRRRRVASIS